MFGGYKIEGWSSGMGGAGREKLKSSTRWRKVLHTQTGVWGTQQVEEKM
jgi:hypothetical protein